jgi:purine-binding chemotaxis protein CheW
MSVTLEELTEQISSRDSSTERYLTFTLGENNYGIRQKQVETVTAWSPIVPVPGMPRFVPGILNYDKIRIPVIDMRNLFKLTLVPFGPATAVIVVKTGMDGRRNRVVGLLVDAVTGHREIRNEDVTQPQNLAGMAKTNAASGMATLNDENIILLDTERLMRSSGALQAVDGV